MIMNNMAFESEPAVGEQGSECLCLRLHGPCLHCCINRDVIANVCDLMETNGKAVIGNVHMGFE